MLLENWDKSYESFINKNIEEIKSIEKEIGVNYTPKKENIFRFMKKPIKDIKVIILGQDPYPQEGAATGRCFEVGGLSSWQDSFRQTSLKNIIRVVYKTYNGKLIKFSEIKEEIKVGNFNVLPPNELFASWDKQGVLLLNKFLTCEIGKPGSHESIWNDFSERLIEYIDNENENIYWFLWGDKAIKNEKYIKNGIVVKALHPRINDFKKETDFLNTKCFDITKDKIDWRGEIL